MQNKTNFNSNMCLKNSLEPLFFGGGSLKVGHPFLGGVGLKWMESGQGGRGGRKRPKMGGRPLYKPPFIQYIQKKLPSITFLKEKIKQNYSLTRHVTSIRHRKGH